MFEEYKDAAKARRLPPEKLPPTARPEKFRQHEMVENFFEESALIGLVTGMEPYRLCWRLNRTLDMNFCGMPDLTIALHEGGEEVLFPVFQYRIPTNNTGHIIYKLKNGNHYLLPRLKKGKALEKLDYLWLLQSDRPEAAAAELIDQLKTVDDIVYARLLEEELVDRLNLLL